MRRSPPATPTVTRVLVKGEPVESPAGRGDDFAWPRRDVAAFGKDPGRRHHQPADPGDAAAAGEDHGGGSERRNAERVGKAVAAGPSARRSRAAADEGGSSRCSARSSAELCADPGRAIAR